MMAKPLKAIEHQLLPDAESVYQLLNQAGPIQSFRPRGRQCQLISGQLQLQDVLLHSYCGSDSDFVVQPWGLVSVQATFSGTITVQDGERLYSCKDSHSDVSLFIDPLAIRRVTAAMAGEGPESSTKAEQPWLFPMVKLEPSQASILFSLLHTIDTFASVDPELPMRLGLEDVILRQVACWLQPELLAAPLGQACPAVDRRSRAAFNELLDYIRAHLDQPLRLSDLEARSFYSRRALQYAFRDKLNTSPVQWIREQRLSRAMEHLQQEGPAASIQAVALACGYRQTSQFSTDFKRRFGLSPSQVKRASLG
jgi:AraC-like DNA-binding protein